MNGWDQIGKGKVKILLAACMLDKPSKAWHDCILQATLQNIFYRYCSVTATLLPFARNEVLKKMCAYGEEITHVLFIDVDMCNFTADDIIKLVEADKPVISGICTMRLPPFQITSAFDSDEPVLQYIQDKEVRLTHHSGLAFTLIRKEVLDAIVEQTVDGPVWFTTDREERDSFEIEKDVFIREKCKEIQNLDDAIPKKELLSKAKKKINLNEILDEAITMGQMSHIGTKLRGEDVAFCRRVEQVGFNSFTHCGVVIGHLSEEVKDYKNAIIKGT